ncbi:hypothetical protein JKA74_13950 [Marivirga sp. S37H4]|uniref:Uncharacterized protein n=1 Tax=Marivirga aurantiaca TaxID=2802615 RepID=A0A935CCM3_9BACT|nr:hypothetical protein [Marivirga aurantiaca]MBK6266143.1 hypothetical protein [Marivirga aurantiaca]
MTGGLGFARMGQDSLKKNRDMLNPRHRMKDNPYSPYKGITYEVVAKNHEELKAWKLLKEKSNKRRHSIIYLIVALFVCLGIFLAILMQ